MRTINCRGAEAPVFLEKLHIFGWFSRFSVGVSLEVLHDWTLSKWEGWLFT